MQAGTFRMHFPYCFGVFPTLELSEAGKTSPQEKNKMKISPSPGAFVVRSFVSAVILSLPFAAHGQGCVAAHSPQPIISGLDPTSQFSARKFSNGDWIHGLTLTVGYRVYNSYKHYIGTVYQIQRQEQHSAVVNHVNLFEVDVNYRLSPRNSFIAYVPFLDASRHGQSQSPQRLSFLGHRRHDTGR